MGVFHINYWIICKKKKPISEISTKTLRLYSHITILTVMLYRKLGDTKLILIGARISVLFLECIVRVRVRLFLDKLFHRISEHVNLLLMLEERSRDHQTNEDSTSRNPKWLYQISWQSIQLLLR